MFSTIFSQATSRGTRLICDREGFRRPLSLTSGLCHCSVRLQDRSFKNESSSENVIILYGVVWTCFSPGLAVHVVYSHVVYPNKQVCVLQMSQQLRIKCKWLIYLFSFFPFICSKGCYNKLFCLFWMLSLLASVMNIELISHTHHPATANAHWSTKCVLIHCSQKHYEAYLV